MSGPTFVNFSRVSGRLRSTLERIATHVCGPWQCAPTHFGYLRPSDDPYDGGVALVGELAECTTEDARALADAEQPFALLYVGHRPRASFGVHFTEITEEGHTVTVEVERSIVYHRDDEYGAPGRWFEGFLIALAAAVGADVCAAGDTVVVDDKELSLGEITDRMRRPRYLALDPDAVLDGLRHGSLLALPGPVLHAVTAKLLDAATIARLMKERRVARGLVYEQAAGYHVFSNIVIP